MRWKRSERPAGSLFLDEGGNCAARIIPLKAGKGFEWSIWIGAKGKRVLHMAHETRYLSTAKLMAKMQLELLIESASPVTAKISPIEFEGRVTMVYPAKNKKPAIVVLHTDNKQITALRVPDLQEFTVGMRVKITVEQLS